MIERVKGIEDKQKRSEQIQAVVNVMDYAYPAGKKGDILIEAKANDLSKLQKGDPSSLFVFFFG